MQLLVATTTTGTLNLSQIANGAQQVIKKIKKIKSFFYKNIYGRRQKIGMDGNRKHNYFFRPNRNWKYKKRKK